MSHLETYRVTEILGWFKEDWQIDFLLKHGKREAKRRMNSAAKIGTTVHEIIEKELCGKVSKKKLKHEEVTALKAFERFKKDYALSTISTEEEVRSDKWGVVGHYDWLGRVNQWKCLLDWKTSSVIGEKYWIQANVYNYMAGVPADYVGIVRLDKNIGDYEFQIREYDTNLVHLFGNMVAVFRHFNKPDGAPDKGKGEEDGTVTNQEVHGGQIVATSEDTDDRFAEDRKE